MPDTRKTIVDTARALFYERGYHATSLAQIQKACGVNGGSIYHFFKSKEALLIAVLENYLKQLEAEVMAPAFATTENPRERVFAVLDGYRRMLVESEFAAGCPIGNLALELPDAGPEVRQLIESNFDAWCGFIADCFEGAHVADGETRARLARLALTVMEGGILQARGRRSIGPFDEAVDQFRDYVDRVLDSVDEVDGHAVPSG